MPDPSTVEATRQTMAITALVSGPTTAMAAAVAGVERAASKAVCPPQRSATTRWTVCPKARAVTAWAASWARTLSRSASA